MLIKEFQVQNHSRRTILFRANKNWRNELFEFVLGWHNDSLMKQTRSVHITEQENKNTKAKTIRDVNLLRQFLQSQNELRSLEDIEPEALNNYLSQFLISVGRKDGFLSSFHRHLKAHGYPVNIIEDIAFQTTRKCLEATCKKLKKEGKGNKPFAAQALTDNEINILYEKGLLGTSSGEALLNTLWLFNSLHFGLHGCDEHRQMCWGDIKLTTMSDGTEVLEYSERQTKTRTGSEPRNIRPVKPKAFPAPNGPADRDPVKVYKVYLSKRPEATNIPEAPFYLGINHTKNPSSRKCWYKANAKGFNKLNSLKTMAAKAGLENQRLTNHSARKRMIQTLNDNDIPPSHIMQISGHRNVQSINNYSHVSQEQQKTMSRILSSSSTSSSSPSSSLSTSQEVMRKGQLSLTTATYSSGLQKHGEPCSGLFAGAVIHGGHFNININTVEKSPTFTTNRVQCYKRLKVIESSDEEVLRFTKQQVDHQYRQPIL